MPGQFNPTSQHEVQRQLGRCLIRIQQYETLLKSMLSTHRLGGVAHELKSLQAQNASRLANKTLGKLVETLFETYVVNEKPPSLVLDDARLPADQIAFSFEYHLQMDEQRLVQVKTSIEELVSLRNDLVHHFIERFALWTNEGCSAALIDLHESYSRIDQHYLELREWALRMDQVRQMAESFVQSTAYQDYVVDGIAPDGSVDWEWAGIVHLLKEALEKHSVGGWLRLDDAKAWMAQHHPEQTPHRYRCKSWPHVLSESRAFRLEYRREGELRVAWFRAVG